MTKDEKIALLEQFVSYIAKDYIELSHEKVRIQRDDYVREARDIMKRLYDETDS